MNIHFKSYNGDIITLPYKDHMPGATPFKEIDSPKKMQKFILLFQRRCLYLYQYEKNVYISAWNRSYE